MAVPSLIDGGHNTEVLYVWLFQAWLMVKTFLGGCMCGCFSLD